MVEVDPNIFFALIGIGISIGGAVLAFAFKNTRDITEIQGCIKRIEDRLDVHEEESEKDSERLRAAEKDIVRLQDRAD